MPSLEKMPDTTTTESQQIPSTRESISGNNCDAAQNIISEVASNISRDWKISEVLSSDRTEEVQKNETISNVYVETVGEETTSTSIISEFQCRTPIVASKQHQTLTLSTMKSKVPFHESELPSSPTELACYVRTYADEISFLVNEQYCDTSHLCENCYSMRMELERLANKLESIAKSKEVKVKAIHSVTKDLSANEEIEQKLNIHEQLIEEKKRSDELQSANEILSKNLEKEENLRKLKEKELEDFKFLFEDSIIEQSKKIEELESRNEQLMKALQKQGQMSFIEPKQLKEEKDRKLEGSEFDKSIDTEEFTILNVQVETELPNAKGESDEPGMKLDGVESENTEAIELLNNIVKSGSLTSMQNKIEEILAICQNQSQKQFQNDIMEESTNTVIMNNQKIEAIAAENKNFGTMNNLSYKLDRCCDAIEFQNSQIKALENNLISANEETKKATIVTVLKVNWRCGKILRKCKKISNDRKCRNAIESLKKLIEKNSLADENFAEERRLLMRQTVEKALKNYDRIIETHKAEEGEKTDAICSKIFEVMKAIENQKNLFLHTSQNTEEKFFSKIEQERTKWEKTVEIFNEKLTSMVDNLQNDAHNMERKIDGSKLFNEEMIKMNTINVELAKTLKVMEEKYSKLEAEFNIVKQKWQEDLAFSKNKLHKIRQKNGILKKTIQSLEGKLNKSEKGMKEMKERCEEKERIMNERIENFDTDDDDEENMVVAKQRIKLLLLDNNRLGDACDEADEEIEKLKNELENLKAKLANLEEEKCPSSNFEDQTDSFDSAKKHLKPKANWLNLADSLESLKSGQSTTSQQYNCNVQEEMLMDLLNEIPIEGESEVSEISEISEENDYSTL